MKTSPTQRSLAKLRKEGWTCCVTEKWVPATPAGFKGRIIRKDAFGFGDLLACKVGVNGATLIQTTSGSNVAARIAKIQSIAEAGIWLASGNKIIVHGWRTVGKRGKIKHWECREVPIEKPYIEVLLVNPTPEEADLFSKAGMVPA